MDGDIELMGAFTNLKEENIECDEGSVFMK